MAGRLEHSRTPTLEFEAWILTPLLYSLTLKIKILSTIGIEKIKPLHNIFGPVQECHGFEPIPPGAECGVRNTCTGSHHMFMLVSFPQGALLSG